MSIRTAKPKPKDVEAFFNEFIAPATREDGGDIAFVKMEGNTVYVVASALCSICPARQRTLKHFVEARLREKFGQQINVAATVKKPYFYA